MPGPDPQALAALQAMRGPAAPPAEGPPAAPGMAPADANKDMPMAVDKPSKELFIDRSLFADLPVKKGQEVTLTGKITTTGASVGFMPVSVAPATPEPGEGTDGEEQFDADLDTEVGGQGE